MSRRMTFRTIGLAVALPVCLAAGPVLAQVQPGNPNAANQSLSNMGASRTMQQGQTSQNNTTMMNIERSQNAPPTPAPPAPISRGGR